LLFLFEDCALDSDRRELYRASRPVAVEPQVFDLLEFLIRNRSRVVSKEDLRAAIWRGRIVSESTLTTRLNAARAAIGDSGEAQRFIRTLPRKGLRFVGEVQVGAESAAGQEKSVEPILLGSAAGDEAVPPETALLSQKPSIAVLPFVNMSDDPEHDYFADGIVEDIITALSRFRSFLVIARNSSFIYKGGAVDLNKVAEELGVRYVLEGSVRKVGKRLRITGQLIDIESGGHLWADRYDGDVGDIFEFQDKVTASVAAAIEPRVLSAEIARATRKSTKKLAAYDYCLRARPLVIVPMPQTIREAVGLLRSAIEIDPVYAQAWALMALCANNRYVRGFEEDSQAAIADAVEWARKAIACDRDDAEVLAVGGYMLSSLGGEFDEAADLLDRAVELNPYSSAVCTFGAWGRLCCGDFAAAATLFRMGLVIDPFSPHGMSASLGLAAAHFYLKQHAEAAQWARRALGKNPQLTAAYRYLAAALAHEGHIVEARQAIVILLALQPNSSLTRSRLNTFRHKWMLDHYLSGLRLAGLPE
jgi:TolB-like protein